jgi:hypothetical protein
MDIAERKALVARFIERCNEYAESKLEQYKKQLERASAADALAIQDKIGHWTAYRAFNDHTLRELATAELDDWLE